MSPETEVRCRTELVPAIVLPPASPQLYSRPLERRCLVRPRFGAVRNSSPELYSVRPRFGAVRNSSPESQCRTELVPGITVPYGTRPRNHTSPESHVSRLRPQWWSRGFSSIPPGRAQPSPKNKCETCLGPPPDSPASLARHAPPARRDYPETSACRRSFSSTREQTLVCQTAPDANPDLCAHRRSCVRR